jgi:hypothetical protein
MVFRFEWPWTGDFFFPRHIRCSRVTCHALSIWNFSLMIISSPKAFHTCVARL